MYVCVCVCEFAFFQRILCGGCAYVANAYVIPRHHQAAEAYRSLNETYREYVDCVVSQVRAHIIYSRVMTCIRTYTHAHARAHSHTHTRTRACSPYTHTHIHAHLYTHTHLHVYSQIFMHTTCTRPLMHCTLQKTNASEGKFCCCFFLSGSL